ncbi:MAG: DNA primase [Saezia sp.]
MATIPQAFIQDLVSRADIVDVIGRYMTLKKAGTNFKGNCPFHNEKTPSFIVSPVRQTYHCFGCGVHGNAIGFLMEHNGLGFVDAVKDLSQQMGLKVPEENISPQQQAFEQQRKAQQQLITDVLAQAAGYWQAALLKSPHAIAYVKKRGLSRDIVTRYGIGYAPPGWQELEKVFDDYAHNPLLLEAGLVIDAQSHDPSADERRYDRFRDRLMFPIRNIKGEVIGFGGRVFGQGEPKYLNSPETPVFLKGHELYGLYEARSEIRHHNYVLITEGYMDVVALAQHGFTNAVATLGTACTPEHMQKIFKFTDSIIFSFDGDNAGRKAARRALEIALPFAKDTRSIKFLFLPAEHDPDSYIREHGAEAFKLMVAGAMPLSQFLLEAAREGCDLGTPEGRAHMLAQAFPLWGQFPSGTLSVQMLAEIASAGQIDTPTLQSLWAEQLTTTPPPPSESYNSAAASPGSSSAPPYSRGEHYGSSPSKQSYGNRYGTKNTWQSGRKMPLPMPAQAPKTPVEYVIRILMIHSGWWEKISTSDHEMLCSQPGWQGEFFKWLERQITDNGAMSWAVLSQAAKTQTWFDMMMALVDEVMLEADIPLEELLVSLERTRHVRPLQGAHLLQKTMLKRQP